MPETIGALILSIASVSATAGVTIAAGVTVTYASIVGATVLAAASLAVSSSIGVPTAPKPDGQQTLQQPIPFRRRGYGRCKLGGYYILWTSAKGNMYTLVAILAQQIDGYEEFWVSDRKVALDGSGFVTSVTAPAGANPTQFNPGGKKVVQILSKTGAPGKTAYAELIAALPTIWTEAHVGYGIADILMIENGVDQNSFSTVYPGGIQSIRAVLRAALVLDPRDDTVAWKDNAILVILDYLSNADGWRVNPDTFLTGMARDITMSSIAICDEPIPLLSGGTEPRYRIWGFYDFNEEPRQVLGRMLAACGGWLQPMPDGTIGLRAGAWVEPDFTFTDDMLLGFEVQHFVGEFDAINEVRATFSDPENDYQDTESTPWQDEQDIERRGYIKSTTIDARHCPSFTQTRRVQKIAYHEASPEFSLTLTTNKKGLAARNRKFVNVRLNQLGIVGTYRVTSFVADVQTGVCTVGLASFGPDAYTWDPSTEEGPSPALPSDIASAGGVETPTNLTVVVETKTVSGSTVGAIMSISCDPPVFRTDLTVKFEYQIHDSGNWVTLSQGTQNYQSDTAIIADGTYDVRASFIASSAVQSTFEEVDSIVVSASAAAPTPPTGLHAALETGGHVDITFTSPNSPTFVAARVWRSAVNTFGTATDISGPIYGSPNQNLSYTDTPGSGTWYYWVTAESGTGARSAPAGSVTVTV